MSGIMAVAEGLNSAAMLGVKGGVTQIVGQPDSPVNDAICDGNGNSTPAPSSGYENVV